MQLDKENLNPDENSSQPDKWIQLILDSTPSATLIIESVRDENEVIINFSVLYANKKLAKLYGASHLKGRLLLQILPEFAESKLFNNLVEVATLGKSLKVKVNLKLNQNNVPFYLHAVQINDGCYITLSSDENPESTEYTKTNKKEKNAYKKDMNRKDAILTSIMNACPLAVLITNKDGEITYINNIAKQYYKHSGISNFTIDDLKKINGRWTKSKRNLTFEDWPLIRALFKGETLIEEEIEIFRPDGSSSYSLHNATPVIDSEMNITGSVVIVKDITETKKAENKVIFSEEKKSYLLKLSDTLHFIDDPNQIQLEALDILGEYLGANRAGYIEDSGDGKTVNILCNYINDAEDIRGTYRYDDYGAEVLKELKEGKTVTIEDVHDSSMPAANVSYLKAKGMAYKPLLKNGELSAIMFVHYNDKHLWTLEEKEIIEETAERIWTAVEWARAENTLRNVESTYLKKLEEEVRIRTQELNENKHFTQLITDSTPDIFFVYDIQQWEIVFVNKGITTTLQYTPQEIYNYTLEDFERILYPDDLNRRINELAKMEDLKPGEIRESNFRIIAKNSKVHWLNVRDVFLKAGKDGKTSQILSICLDITERVEALEAYRKEKDRSKELKRMNELMDTFVFAAAHDLKAPISNLKILTRIINTIDDTGKKLELQKKYDEIIETLDLTISGLVKVLAVEKDSSSGIKSLSFLKVFNNIKAEMKDELEEINPEITIDLSQCKTIQYIESYLYSIFRNLLSNSLKFRRKDKKLRLIIQTGHKGRYVWLSFTDNGTGINLDKYGADMFKPFKRFSSQTKGSGLGLNLIKSVVTKNGGYVDVLSKKSEGTTFTVYMVPYKK